METSIRQSAKKKKILFVITQGEMGGAQRYVFDLAAQLAGKQTNVNNPPQSPLKIRGEEKGSYEVRVAIGKENPALKNSLAAKGIETFELKYLRRNIHPLLDPLAVWELKNLIQTFRPQIIHLNSSKAGVVGSLAAGLAGNPNVVFTAHGFAFLEPHNFLVRQIYFWAEKLASRFRRKIITVSEFDRREAIKSRLCPPEKLITIHNGIDSSLYPSPRSGEGGPGTPGGEGARSEVKPSIIGTLAHDYPTKDLKTLRSAFQILKREFPNLELVIIGRGGTTGEVPNATNLLANFDIYVCSSIKEGFPYSLLEAMAAGLPIVSTAVGGIPEMLDSSLYPSPRSGEGGPGTPGGEGVEREVMGEGACAILVPSRNPPALAAAIKKLLTNPELAQKLGQNARAKVHKFSLDRMVQETKGVYQTIL